MSSTVSVVKVSVVLTPRFFPNRGEEVSKEFVRYVSVWVITTIVVWDVSHGTPVM